MNNSGLFDEKTFYDKFISDLNRCKNEVIIESPFITSNRVKLFYPIFQKLLTKGVNIYVITRDLEDQESIELRAQADTAICNFERMGVNTLLCIGNHHRKLAILDRKILWEGSLNILSQWHSREIMRRIDEAQYAIQMFDYLGLKKIL